LRKFAPPVINLLMTTAANKAGKAMGLRAREIERWADRADALGCADVSDALRCLMADVVGSAEETEKLLRSARAALILEVFGEEE
jgi:hypothetical protein